MKRIYFIIQFTFLACQIIAQVAPNIDWVADFSEREQIENVPSAIDAGNNVYVTGYTDYLGSFDYTTIKYNDAGVLQWVSRYDGAGGDDESHAIVLDNSGNIYITGESAGAGTGLDYATIKYDAAGNELWSVRYNGPANGDDIAVAIEVDNAGNVFVTGRSEGIGTGFDYTTIKYNSSGVEQWVARENGTANGADQGLALVRGVGNRLFVTGTLTNSGTGRDVVTIRYNANTGANQWTYTKNGSANGNDGSYALALDGIDVIVAGGVNQSGTSIDYYFVKLNGNTGSAILEETYDAYYNNDFATDIEVDGTGNYVLTGMVYNSGIFEYHTVMYNSVGAFQWANIESTDQLTFIVRPTLKVDFVDHFYVCGERNFTGNTNMFIYQITPGGNTSWRYDYDGAANGYDAAVDMVMGSLGEIFVAAQTQNAGAKWDYTTIKFSQTPVYFPPDFYNEPAQNIFAYYENRGQLMNDAGSPADNVSYYAQQRGFSLFVHDKGFSMVKRVWNDTISIPDTTHHVVMTHKNHNPNARAFHYEDVPTKHNYYRPHIPNGVVDVMGYNRLFYPNYYDGIDLHLYNSTEGWKYYFVVRPGEDPSVILHEFTGADATYINGSNELVVETSLGEITFRQPTAYQVNFALNIVPLGAAYWNNVAADKFDFTLPGYNPLLPLVIQVDQGIAPTSSSTPPGDNLNWSTYYGGNGLTSFNDVDNDFIGHTFITGNTTDNSFPLANGQSFIPLFTAGLEAILLRIDENIVPLWVTFFGGATGTGLGLYPDEISNSVGFSPSNNSIYIGGSTSSTDIPIEDGDGNPLICTSSTYWAECIPCIGGTTCNGGFVARFSPGGILQWSTYITGNGAIVRDLDVDKVGNLYIAGVGGVGMTLQTLPGAYNSTAPGSMIMKFDAGNDRVWSTKFEGADDIYSITTDNNNRLYITGETDGSTPLSVINPPVSTIPFTATGDFNVDAFITMFNTNDDLQYNFYYGGNCIEAGKSIEVDGANNVYVAGYLFDSAPNPDCPGTSNLPVIGSGYPWSGLLWDKEHFLVKINAYTGGEPVISYSGYIGGGGHEWDDAPFLLHGKSDISLAVRSDGYVFLAGQTTSGDVFAIASPTIQMPGVQPAGFYVRDDFRSNIETKTDAYIMGFDSNMVHKWTTYFGGDEQDGSTAMSVSEFDNRLYYVGNTNTDNSLFPNNPLPTWDYDGFIATASYFQSVPWASSKPGWAAMFDLNGIEIPTGISDYVGDGGLLIYPNPNDGEFTIRTEATVEVLKVYDVTGRLVLDEEPNNTVFVVDLTKQPVGIYYVEVQTDSGVYGNKIIIH